MNTQQQQPVFILATAAASDGTQRYTGRVVEIDGDMVRFFKIKKQDKHASKAAALAHYAAQLAASSKAATAAHYAAMATAAAAAKTK